MTLFDRNSPFRAVAPDPAAGAPLDVAPELPADGAPLNVSRRAFLGGAGALTLVVALPMRRARGQGADAPPPPAVPAFLELREDGTALLRSPFVEGGQGIFTAMAQIVGEELDLAPEAFEVVNAPAGEDYLVMGGMRLTGGSMSVRMSYATMRRLGASARAMVLAAAAEELGVDAAELTTEPGRVVHRASGRSLGYGALAQAAAGQAVPAEVTLKDPESFRWIRQPVDRIDVRAKSTGKAEYGIDLAVDNMLLAAVRHAPRRGQAPGEIANRAEIEAMKGVHSVQLLPDAVAVLADRWWRARKAVEALEIAWVEGVSETPMPADFSSAGWRERMAALQGDVAEAEVEGDAPRALAAAAAVIEATYDAPFLAHGQLEPPSAIARFNDDGTLEIWTPNQAPEQFQAVAADLAGLEPAQVSIHSPILGGFFGRHFRYGDSNVMPQAIALAKAAGRPVKVLWTREEEFLRDALRPMGVARLRAALDDAGRAVAIEALAMGEGPTGRWYGAPPGRDPSAVEGLAGKVYAIPNRRVGQIFAKNPAQLGYWRSVGHSMHDFFYEGFLDELAEAGGQDPFELRRTLLADQPRHLALLEAVGELSGGWRRGPFEAQDGSRRARGVAMASPFGSEVATVAEVSIEAGEVRVHDVWVAIDPGEIVNPAIIEAQVQSAVALGLSQALFEEVVYEDGLPQARNYDLYRILSRYEMPRVHTRILRSGAPMGGIGEPGLPGVPPAVVNAVAALTGRRIRSLPLSNHDLSAQSG